MLIAVLVFFLFLESGRSWDIPIVEGHEEAPGIFVGELLSDPGQYDGKYIQVTGYVRLDIGGDGIYPSQETALDFKKGIWLEINSEEIKKYRSSYDGQYCLIEGKFNAQNKGRMGRWNGALEEISRLEPQPLSEPFLE